MLVSHRFGFIYTKTIKTGGTSVESYFERFCMPEGEWTFSHGRPQYVSDAGIIGFRGKDRPVGVMWGVFQVMLCGLLSRRNQWWNHMPARAIKNRVGQETWERYFKFCVIRNPYEKALSSFFFFTHNTRRADVPLPQQFEEWLHTKDALPLDRDKYVIDGKLCMDDFIRCESMAHDMKRVCNRLGVPWEPERLPRLKARFRPADATIENIYTPTSRRIVEKVYAFEFATFGYR